MNNACMFELGWKVQMSECITIPLFWFCKLYGILEISPRTKLLICIHEILNSVK